MIGTDIAQISFKKNYQVELKLVNLNLIIIYRINPKGNVKCK